MLDLAELSSVVLPLTDLLFSITAPEPLPASVEMLVPTPTAALVPSDVSWWEKFSTGPPMAGIFAVAAAGLAYSGILKQVAKTTEANRLSEESNDHTRSANEENVRKNAEDQWWSTLKWAYEEAKNHKDSNDLTEPLALVGILQNLGELEGISEFQSSTADNVITLFKESKDPLVRETAERASETVRQAASVQGQSPKQYEEALHGALTDLMPTIGATLYGDGESVLWGADWILETFDHKFIAIEHKYHHRGTFTAKNQILTAFGYVGEKPVTNDWIENPTPISGVLLVSNLPTIIENEAWIKRHQNEIGFIHWNPEDGYGPLAISLKSLTKDQLSDTGQNPRI